MQKHDSAKKDFTDVYENETPRYYYEEFLTRLGMVEREEILAKYVEFALLDTFKQWNQDLGCPLSVMDFLGCFGNTTLAITNCFHKQDYEKMWSTDKHCYELHKPRQFPCSVWACDISRNACEYGLKAGIYDETDLLDLNQLTEEQICNVRSRCQNANILHINSLGYITDSVLFDIMNWFSEGTSPGMFIVGFAYPYNGVERMQKWKKYALEKFEFHSSVPSVSRSLCEKEPANYGPMYGNWERSYYEMWFLKRKV